MSKIIDKGKELFYNSKDKVNDFLKKAKIRYPKVFDSRYNKRLVIVSFVVILSLIMTASYATFVFLTGEYKAADIRFANLMYSIKVDNATTKALTSKPNSVTTYELDMDALNEIGSKYLVYYTSENDLTNVKVEYSNLSTSKGDGKISPTGNRVIRIVVTNNSDSEVNLNFNVKGGYVYNSLNLNTGEYKIDGIYDEKSLSAGDVVVRTYLNGKSVEEMPNYEDMTKNDYVFDDLASSCTNEATINYIATNGSEKLDIQNIKGPTECIAVFHDKDDLTLTVIADNLLVSEIPLKDSGYVYEDAKCNNGANIAWDSNTWTNSINNISQTNTSCVLRFKK